ncbi:MAG: hypothetical protein MJ180_05290, partial [Candidatus Gastranaerophilales bacterium]|nr:hypothetical protein [Candidatus Gastranaerophilales bacterium]
VANMEDATITNSSASGSVTGSMSTGGLVGYANGGSITNSSTSGNVTGTGECTGGLVGSAYEEGSSITNSSASGSVTGNNSTGGLVGYAEGSITNSSASGSVTGNNSTGGLVGFANGSITQSYATGDVEGTTCVGGIAGATIFGEISNSYSLSNVKGDNKVGGLIGGNSATVTNSYSTGNVTSSGTEVGGFVGMQGNDRDVPPEGSISNCYSTADMEFYGNKQAGSITNNYGTKSQPGVEQHEADWFNDGSNLTFLGSAFNTNVIPPDLVDNPRPVPPPPPTTEGIQFQIGANSGEENTLKIDTSFSLNGFDADVTTREKANETIDKVDALISEFSIRRSGYGAVQNRLESVMDSLTTKTNNLSASHSTIVDTDFAAESANLVKAQILQNATAALLAQANSAPSIALRLLE